MSVQVKLPTILRKHAGGEPKVSADGATLRDVLDDLETKYPGITKNVRSEDGGLHRFINIYLNDEDVRYLGSLETEVGEGDTVSILPAVAGGQGPPLRADERASGRPAETTAAAWARTR
jgi:molybdopterin converting factor small subunit